MRRFCRILATVAAVALVGPSAPRTEVIDLRATDLAETPGGLDLLHYIVTCALPPRAAARVATNRQVLKLSGKIGIAPDWQRRALTPGERELVSACVLALTNAFGVPVRISMRANAEGGHSPSSLRASASERSAFPLYEGDIFADGTPAYACTGDSSAQAIAQLRRLRRICTLPSALGTQDGRDVSACGFVLLGACGTDANVVDGVYFPEPIHVYLPDG